MAPALLAALAIVGSPPVFLESTRGADLSDLLVAPHVPSREQALDLDGDGQPERVVLVGRPGPEGVIYPVALLLASERAGRLIVLATAPLGLNPAYDAQFAAGPPRDLDGDGYPEIAVDERAGGPGVEILGTTFWRFSGGTLLPTYHLQRRAAVGRAVEERTMALRKPGLIVERHVTTRPGATPEPVEATLRFDPAEGRFLPSPTASLRPR